MTTTSLDAICQLLAQIAPLALAESWDNVGLLIGNRAAAIDRVMTCLSITPAVVTEAVQRDVDLIVAHHPLPFKPVAKLTSDSPSGRMLLELIAGGVAVYSAHTAFDSAAGGINDMWAQGLELADIVPLIVPHGAADAGFGSGRCGRLAAAVAVEKLASAAAAIAGVDEYRIVGPGTQVRTVGIACGSGGSFLSAASMRGCQVLLTGEATFHTCLEAEALGMALILLGHYGSERFAMRRMAVLLKERLGRGGIDVEVFASSADIDPLHAVRMGVSKH